MLYYKVSPQNLVPLSKTHHHARGKGYVEVKRYYLGTSMFICYKRITGVCSVISSLLALAYLLY